MGFFDVIQAIIALTVIVLAHELGHFLAAKWAKIEVREFSVGFGPMLISWGGDKEGEEKAEGEMVKTVYGWRLFPLGASVRMTGEEIGDAPSPYSYSSKTPFQKAVVAVSGPLMNLLVAMLVFIFVFSIYGKDELVNIPVIGYVVPNGPAEKVGIKPNDRIITVNGKHVASWDQSVSAIQGQPKDKTIQLKVERNKKTLVFNVKPQWDPMAESYYIGIMASTRAVKVGIVEANKIGFKATYDITARILKSFKLLVTGGVSKDDMGGPIRIAQLMGGEAHKGLLELVWLTAVISINLGVFNLLPIPALDGSRIVFAIIEVVRRRPVEPEKENMVHLVGLVFLLALIFLVTVNDVWRIIKEAL
ncbi:MAG: RIP metalloprotease RseP [Candidatus Saccharibacteria bacterium]